MPVVGERWGAFELVRVIGQGSFAEVWEVRHAALGSRHALKILGAQWAEHASIRARFLAEGRILAQIRHPNLVAVTDLVDDGPGRLGLVMDLVDGPSLGRRLAEHGRFATPLALGIARGIAAGLHRVHEAGIVHRDLKPDNVLLVTDGDVTTPVVVDFGVAKILDAADVEIPKQIGTRATTRLGTPQYMAPEQAEASHAVDRRADVFALGAVLYEMLAGHPAFEGGTIAEVLYRAERGERRPLDDIDPAIVDVVDRALAVTPDARFPSMVELEDALGALLVSFSLPSLPRPLATKGDVRHAAGGRPRAAHALRVAAAMLAALGLASVAWIALGPAPASPSSSASREAAEPTADPLPAEGAGSGIAPSAPSPRPPEAAPPRLAEPSPVVEAPPPRSPAPESPRPDASAPPPASPPAQSSAVTDTAAVDAAWARLARPLARCAPADSPPQRWKVAVQIGVEGRPTSVRASTTRGAPAVATCLEKAAQRLDAGKLSGSTSRVFSLSLP